MTPMPERLYAALLRCYPRSFRDQFGPAMIEAFGELRRRDAGRLRLWAFVLVDLARSAWREWCETLSGRFTLRWTLACAFGAVTTGVLGSALSRTFTYLYHPFLEGVAAPAWGYGALLGLGLGLTQTVALRDRVRLGAVWVGMTSVSAGLGLEVAVRFASVTGAAAYGGVLGCIVASGQWLVLRKRMPRAGWRVASSGAALAVGVLSCGVALNGTIRGLNPLANDVLASHGESPGLALLLRGLYAPGNWAELAVELGVLAISGLVIGVLTAKPLSLILPRVE